ncbi:alpha/beta hydrolase [Oscillatoria sp. CS-180]|uniref:alpha/beta fold hydrolase n=1 Tax=Oscillatoria sp. CS-180 TaxID=3021720 RepID=UPI00232C936C|nr:alpha/beta hydrolase [Oscillatoria sp. CS-180]MDB9524456.1 alpha/beta hydrolase [Oscillatoria sp. CS-180]
MPYVSVFGVDHYYEWLTEGETGPNGIKPIMVFIHGWGGSCRYWRSTARSLSSQFDCLLYDMRGFGQSRIKTNDREAVLARGYELDTFADDLAELLNALEIDRIWLNSHSTGASVAALFLNQYGDRVNQAILTCNGIFEYDKKAFEAFYTFGGYVVRFRPAWLSRIPLAPRVFMARFLSRPIPSAERKAFLQDYLSADGDIALGTIYTAVSKRATEIMPAAFKAIAVPTLLVSGEYDQITPAKLGKQAAVLNPEMIKYVEIKNTGHFPMLEAPQIYLEEVNNFLNVA